MKYFLSIIVGILLFLSLSHFAVFGVFRHFDFNNSNPPLDTTKTGYVAHVGNYQLYDLRTFYDKSKSSDIQRSITIYQNFYSFDNLNLDSNSVMRLQIGNKEVIGEFYPSNITLNITKNQIKIFRKIAIGSEFLYFLLQFMLVYFVFRILISYWRNEFYAKKNPRRLLAVGIVTTVIGSFLYFKGLIQQIIINQVTGSYFEIFPKEYWEYVPHISILGLFIIVVSRFYKDAVAIKEQNDLTI